MKILDFFALILFGATICVLPCPAADVYVAQSAQGADTGTDAADAHSIVWLNNPANWGSGPTQVAPGVTLHLCGTVTSSLTFQSGGTVGNPITLFFEPNAKFSAPTWTGNIITGASYMTIDGGNNGIIEATANGTGLANSNNVVAISLRECSGVVIKNLTIQNLYIRSGLDENAFGVGVGLYYNGSNSFSNDLVTNCVFHDMYIGFSIAFGPGSSNIQMSHCTAYNCNWGGNAGDGGPGRNLDGLTVDHNHFYNWTNWDDPLDNNHHNGFYAWAESGGTLTNVTYTANYVGPGYGGALGYSGNSSGLFVSGKAYNVLINNNIFDASDGTSPADGQCFIWLRYGTVSTTASVFNNTFIGGLGVNFYQGSGSNLTTYVCKNNAFYRCGYAVLIYWNAQSTFVGDYNNVYDSTYGTPFSSAPASSSAPYSLSQWQSLGYDTHSSAVNPNLNGSYMPLAGSPLLAAGANLTKIFSTDYAGNSRSAAGNWTIGAYEKSVPNSPQNLRVITGGL